MNKNSFANVFKIGTNYELYSIYKGQSQNIPFLLYVSLPPPHTQTESSPISSPIPSPTHHLNKE